MQRMTTPTSGAGRGTGIALEASGFGVVTRFRTEARLSEATRELAAHYLSGAVGRTMGEATFALAPEFLAGNPSPNRQAAEAARLIALHAPLRHLPGEKLAGAATLKEATWHRIPLTEFASISHTTLDFEKALRIGYRGIRAELDARLARGDLDADGLDLLESMRTCLDAAAIWHGRYVALLEERIAMPGNANRSDDVDVLAALRQVPESPPASFREGVQALWLLWDFQRLCGNWSGIGRFDKMLGPLLRADLDAGRITLDEARELVAHFWIKGCEWITAEGQGSGDAQFYQNIVLAGVDEEGQPVANEVTDLVLDVVEELHISDFPIAVRIDARTPSRLLQRIAAIQRLGGGIVAIYNDDRIIANLTSFGYPQDEARNFANDGCWEIIIPGKTAFGYQPFDALLLLQQTLGLSAATPETRTPKPECLEWREHPGGEGHLSQFPDFESLYSDFRARLEATLDHLLDDLPFSDQPTPLISLLVEGCIEKGRGYLAGGPKYTVRSPHAGGLQDVANSLLVIRRLVYETGEFALPEFVAILRADWDGHETLRRRIRSRFDFWGNDSAEADALLQRVFDDYTDYVGRHRERHGVLRPAGISTFGRECAGYLSHRTATPSGQKLGAILATNFSPSPGTDTRGPTAAIRSHCSVDFARLPCGTALELKIPPDSIRGETGLHALATLMRSFVRLGGIFMQIDVVDNQLLRLAQEHPEEYPNLSVRISGWSARFATLSSQWQEMIIARTEQNCGG
jgi:pyruvate-formate lyase